jgi:hypothetical protein
VPANSENLKANFSHVQVEDGSNKISLTIKNVNQTDGHDEDPTHIQAMQDALRSRSGSVRPSCRVTAYECHS